MIFVVAAPLLMLGGLFDMTPLGAAEGQLTRVGGNADGCPTDAQVLADLQQNLSPADRFRPFSINSGVFTRDRGIQAITSNPLVAGVSGVYLLSGGQILGGTSIVAESLNGDDVASPYTTAGIAAYGTSLWAVQKRMSSEVVSGAPLLPGRVRRLDLGTQAVTTVTETKGPNPTAIAADGAGHLYVTEANGDVYMIGRGTKVPLPSVENPTAIAVDVAGAEVFVAGSDSLYRLAGNTKQLVAGPTTTHADGTSPVTAPTSVALGHEIIDGQIPRARYVYIADAGRVVRVDLKGQSPTITTVAGGGSTFVGSSTADARTAKLSVLSMFLAADMAGHIFIADANQCVVYQLETPAPFALKTAVTNPPAITNTTAPTGGSRTGDAEKPAPDPAGAGNNSPQPDPGTGSQIAGQGNQTQIVPGSQTQVQAQPQTELRVLDQGNVLAPEQGTPTVVELVPTPSPTPTPTPTPTPAPAPADAGVAVAPDPSPSGAAAAEASAVVPPAPAPAPAPPPAPAAAPVPPPPASAPPPAAQQPVSSPGLVHGDSAAPTRGATRYAMVRNDEEQSLAAALAMAGAGAAMLAGFLCVLFVAPGASSKPKPRPKGAY